MNVLFLNDFNKTTLTSDLLLHGLCSMGFNVVDYPKIDYMYGNTNFTAVLVPKTSEQIRNLFGTLAYRSNVDRNNIKEKIVANYFDLVVISDPRCSNNLIPTVLENIDEKKLAWIDGSNSVYPEYFIPKGWYFKKEIEHGLAKTYPIGLSLPKEKIPQRCLTFKNNFLLDQTSLDNCGSDFDYYQQIGASYFMITNSLLSKQQLLDYELIVNGCIPIKPMLKHKKFSHDPVQNILKHVSNVVEEKGLTWVYTHSDLYFEFQNTLINLVRHNCTTENMAKMVIKTIS